MIPENLVNGKRERSVNPASHGLSAGEKALKDSQLKVHKSVPGATQKAVYVSCQDSMKHL